MTEWDLSMLAGRHFNPPSFLCMADWWMSTWRLSRWRSCRLDGRFVWIEERGQPVRMRRWRARWRHGNLHPHWLMSCWPFTSSPLSHFPFSLSGDFYSARFFFPLSFFFLYPAGHWCSLLCLSFSLILHPPFSSPLSLSLIELGLGPSSHPRVLFIFSLYFLSFFFLLLPPDPPSIFSFVLFPPSRSAPLSSHSLHPAHLAAPPLTYWSPLHLSFCADPVAMDTASRLSLSLSRSIHLSHAQPCPARAYLLLSFYGFISPPCSPRRRIRPNRSWAPSFLLSFPSCLFFSPPPKGFISIWFSSK